MKQAANDLTLSEEIRVKAKTAALYVACIESTELIDCVTEIVNQLEPLLFCGIGALSNGLGDEMTPALENSTQYYSTNEDCQSALKFFTAMSYVRKDKYDKAIEIFREINEKPDSNLRPFVC